MNIIIFVSWLVSLSVSRCRIWNELISSSLNYIKDYVTDTTWMMVPSVLSVESQPSTPDLPKGKQMASSGNGHIQALLQLRNSPLLATRRTQHPNSLGGEQGGWCCPLQHQSMNTAPDKPKENGQKQRGACPSGTMPVPHTALFTSLYALPALHSVAGRPISLHLRSAVKEWLLSWHAMQQPGRFLLIQISSLS